jgi:4-hydroxythreonine-4-phosphate dehydrogenase
VVAFHRKSIKVAELNIYNLNPTGDKLNPKALNVAEVWNEETIVRFGEENETGGMYARMSLIRATDDLVKGKIQALVTAPVSKNNIQAADYNYKGQTEYITEKAGAQTSLMYMVSPGLKVGIATNHLAVKDVAGNLTVQGIVSKAEMMHQSLMRDFGIVRPRIAVLGLNPHAGDHGLIGKEEETIILPAINAIKDKGILAFGPYPADGFFGNGSFKQFDGVLAMYHDQGLVPFKTITFGTGVNYTAGLNVVRTSPDHGTGFDIAGKGEADPGSFMQAVFTATDIIKARKNYAEMTANPLKKVVKLISEEIS